MRTFGSGLVLLSFPVYVLYRARFALSCVSCSYIHILPPYFPCFMLFDSEYDVFVTHREK